jgi:hypothetical protein
VPTTKEGGLAEFQVSAWNGLFAPKNLPREIQTKLNNAVAMALDDDATRKRLLDIGSEIPNKAGRTPSPFKSLWRVKWLAGHLEGADLLRLSGQYDTKPQRVVFEMAFQAVNNAWRLAGIAVSTVAANQVVQRAEPPAAASQPPKGARPGSPAKQ